MTRLVEHLGNAKRAQTNFCENSPYSLSTLQHWRKTNHVPEKAFDAIQAIDAEKCSPSNFQGPLDARFTKRVIALSVEGNTLSGIASKLSEEFKRPVTENMIKGVRYRNSDKIATYQHRQKGG